MKDRRRYGQYCGVARALDVLGERWTLLIVRDLLPGPRRYGQLADRLPGIATDILTARLRTLEAHGLVTSRREPGRGRPVSYRLTAEGEALRPLVEALADAGSRWLGPPLAPGSHADLGWALGTAASALRPGEVPAAPLVASDGRQSYVIERDGDRVSLGYLGDLPARHVALSGTDIEVLGVLSGHLELTDTSIEAQGDRRTIERWRAAIAAALPADARLAPPGADS